MTNSNQEMKGKKFNRNSLLIVIIYFYASTQHDKD